MLDIETAPLKAYVWRLWKENVGVRQIERDWYMLCWAAKWLGDKEVQCDALPYHKAAFKKDPEDDSRICKPIHKLMDEADVVVGQNSVRFDVPKLNARFLLNGMPPPSPFMQVDTLQIAKRVFGFSSNKLEHQAAQLGFGRKLDTDFGLWKACMEGDLKAWEKMVKYNIHDVVLLEKVYLKYRPWAPNHPNFGLYVDWGVDSPKPLCPACGSDNIQRRGYRMTFVGRYQRFQCMACGRWIKGRTTTLDQVERKALVSGVQ